MLDMDLINAAMVRQNSDPDALAARRAANEAVAKKSELNQDDFLTLMITQLKNQDPFKPMDPAQYVGQLAQFSSVSGLSEMNKQISSLTDSLRGNQVLDGAGLIGRTVIAPGNGVYLPEAVDGEVRGPQALINVPAGASAVQLVVKDLERRW
jgi:flagellar basal-body rod modification protein FlgD